MKSIQFGHNQEGNTMKKALLALIITAVMASPVFAEKHHKQGDDEANGMNGMMNMMSQEKMTAMQEHMQKMREGMKRIKGESDPKKREELMQEHMVFMQEGMQMMNNGMGKEMNKSEHKKGGNAEKMDEANVMSRMKMMEQRMNMMQMMMEQMMQHQSEDKKGM